MLNVSADHYKGVQLTEVN